MKIEFWLREPGENKLALAVEMDFVPRAGENVSLDGETNHEVHSVTYDVQRNTVIVLLR